MCSTIQCYTLSTVSKVFMRYTVSRKFLYIVHSAKKYIVSALLAAVKDADSLVLSSCGRDVK